MSDAFITDPTDEQARLIDNLDHARSSAGLPTTSDLAVQAAPFSAFSTKVHTADTMDRQFVQSRISETGDRTVGGLARPLTPHGGGGLLVVAPPNTAAQSAPGTAGAKKKISLQALDTSNLSPRLSTQQKLAQENFVSRNLPTPLEMDVQKMRISDTTRLITGQGVTSTAVKGRRQSQIDDMIDKGIGTGDGGSQEDTKSND